MPMNRIRVAVLITVVVALAGLSLPAGAVDGSLAQADEPMVIDVFLYGGQSNMVQLIKQARPELEEALRQVVGPDSSTHKTVLLGYALGGTSLYEDWVADGTASSDSDGPQYRTFQTEVAAGLADLEASYPGAEIRIRALLFNQGEADSLEYKGAEYYQNLERFISDVRLTYGLADLAFFPARMRYMNPPAEAVQVRDAVVEWGRVDPHSVAIDLDQINPGSTGVHYTKAGYVTMAGIYGEVFHDYEQPSYGERDCGFGQIHLEECAYLVGEPACVAEDGQLSGTLRTARTESFTVAGPSGTELGTVSADAPLSVELANLADGTTSVPWTVGKVARVKSFDPISCDVDRPGDANCDRAITPSDVRLVLSYQLGDLDGPDCEPDGSVAGPIHPDQCDIDGDLVCRLGDGRLIAVCLSVGSRDRC